MTSPELKWNSVKGFCDHRLYLPLSLLYLQELYLYNCCIQWRGLHQHRTTHCSVVSVDGDESVEGDGEASVEDPDDHNTQMQDPELQTQELQNVLHESV